MRTSVWLWIIAAVIAVFAARFQRVTGPTYPVASRATLGAADFAYRLERSHAGPGDQRVAIAPGAAEVAGTLEWRPLGAGGTWTVVPMRRESADLVAAIPHQPPAGKVQYRVTLRRDGQQVTLPAGGPITLRFRGDVPAWALVPHVVLMMVALLLAARAGMEGFRRQPRLRGLTDWTLVVLFFGGFVLGPLVTWYAFRRLWEGLPVGNDLTDTKTLLAFVAWVIAAIAVRRARHPGHWVAAAAVLTFIVYLIPHSI